MEQKQKWSERQLEYSKQYYEKNKIKINQQKKLCRERKSDEYASVARKRYQEKREEILEKTRERRNTNPEVMLVNLARARAKKKQLPFNICAEDIVIPVTCPLLGIPITRSLNKSSDNSPSLDKIVPELGYVKNNIWVVSLRANRLKSDSQPEELILLAYNLRAKMELIKEN